MSERRKRCEEFLSGHVSKNYANNGGHVQDVPYFIDALEAFAKEQQIKGMEAVRAEFERRKRHIRKSMLDIMFLKWIDAEIAKLKEGG